jgi:hypothetical protein
MAESSWPTSGVTQEHLQNLTNQGYMTVEELGTCCVPKDPASPTPVGDYDVVCMTFFQQGFGAPSH